MRNRLAAKYNMPALQSDEDAIAFSRHLPLRDADFVLGHGTSCRAVIVSEDCVIDGEFGRGEDQRRGRLLFAAIRDSTEEEIRGLIDNPTFDRFPLPADELVDQGGIVDLRRLFMISVDSVDPDLRFASLSDDVAEDLAVHWSAYVTRHGPLPGLRNSEKLALLLAGGRTALPSEEHRRIGGLVSEVVNSSWRFEGEALEGISVAFDEGAGAEEAVVNVTTALDDLAGRALAAAEALRATSKLK
ncbi:MAG TPA: hypothetical protein VD771_02865 [Gemmatimonadaceae bacterium]|nr:hypothetical protein [Gemmatimonadaceae bacterium]